MADPTPPHGHWEDLRESTLEILNVRAEIARRQRPSAALIERIGQILADPWLFIGLLAGHLLWVVLNLPVWPWFEPWDPYPFMFLATVASAEAPFIALMIVMYQRRSTRISELREEIEIQTSLHLERQMTMMLRLLREVQEGLQIPTGQDPRVLDRLQRNLDPQQLMQSIRQNLRRAEDEDEATAP